MFEWVLETGFVRSTGVLMAAIQDLWEKIELPVLNQLKVYLLSKHVNEVLIRFQPQVEVIVRRYARHLPYYVVDSEIDDLKAVAQLEFLETIKVWVPSRCPDIWPLARARIVGAMKDHIRFITRSDPSRLYDWVTDAAYVLMAVQDRADFEHEIETGVQLQEAMKALSLRERKIVLAHTKDDLTFKQIGDLIGVSESQISRIYKKSLEKLRKVIVGPKAPTLGTPFLDEA